MKEVYWLIDGHVLLENKIINVYFLTIGRMTQNYAALQ